MEATRQINKSTRTPITQGWPSNDNRHKPLSMGRSVFPNDAVARIYKPSRAVTTSGMARTRGWRLVFERRTAPFIEPLMGYTGGDDTLTQVELSFPRLESAIRYAERHGLAYVVQQPSKQSRSRRRGRVSETPARNGGSTQAFSDATLDRLGLSDLQDSYGRALDDAANRNDPSGPESWTSPMPPHPSPVRGRRVIDDATLTTRRNEVSLPELEVSRRESNPVHSCDSTEAFPIALAMLNKRRQAGLSF